MFDNDKSGRRITMADFFSFGLYIKFKNQLSTLQAMLPKITEGGFMSNILDLFMYCVKGHGLVGLDFRGLLPPLFEDASIHIGVFLCHQLALPPMV